MRDVAMRHEGLSSHDATRGRGDTSLPKPMGEQHSSEVSEHIFAAWSYISEQENAAKYDDVAVEIIKDRIRWAAKNQGVELGD